MHNQHKYIYIANTVTIKVVNINWEVRILVRLHGDLVFVGMFVSLWVVVRNANVSYVWYLPRNLNMHWSQSKEMHMTCTTVESPAARGGKWSQIGRRSGLGIRLLTNWVSSPQACSSYSYYTWVSSLSSKVKICSLECGTGRAWEQSYIHTEYAKPCGFYSAICDAHEQIMNIHYYLILPQSTLWILWTSLHPWAHQWPKQWRKVDYYSKLKLLL